jgi:hypothetical protein
MAGNLPPGCTDRDIDEAAGAYDDPPDDGAPDELDEAYDRIQMLERELKAARDEVRQLKQTASNLWEPIIGARK